MVRRALPLVLAIALSACGGSPAAPTPPAPPPPPPPPAYPSVVGAWNGTATIVAVVGDLSGSNVCTMSWNITGQSADAFTGTYQFAGGTTTPCAGAGTITGLVSTSNAIAIGLSSSLGATSGCTKTSGDTIYTGTVGATSVSVTATETLVCTGNVVAQRNVVIALNK